MKNKACKPVVFSTEELCRKLGISDETCSKLSAYILIQSQEEPRKALPVDPGAIPEDDFFRLASEQKALIESLYEGAATLGWAQSAHLLYLTAWRSVEALDNLARKRPELLVPLAEKMIMWPAFIGKKASLSGERKRGAAGRSLSNNEWLIDTIKLGKESPHKGKWNVYSRATQHAICMHTWLNQNREWLALPDLTTKSVKEWFEKGWVRLLFATQGMPEKNKYIRAIGLHYGDHSKNNGAQPKGVTISTREANIRAGIRKQIYQSFKTYTGMTK